MNEIFLELEHPHTHLIHDQIIRQDNQVKIKKGKRLYQWKQRTIARDQLEYRMNHILTEHIEVL